MMETFRYSADIPVDVLMFACVFYCYVSVYSSKLEREMYSFQWFIYDDVPSVDYLLRLLALQNKFLLNCVTCVKVR